MVQAHVLVEHHRAAGTEVTHETLTLGGQLHRGEQERAALCATLRSNEMVAGNRLISVTK